MEKDAVVAVFADHAQADAAIKTLAGSGFALKNLSLAGQGYHTDEKVAGFYNTGDRIRFWGSRGAFWGGMWGLFIGGVFLTVPVVGHVVVLGYLATAAIAGLEGATIVGSLSAVGAAIASIGIPHDSVLQYEAAIKADEFVVMAHGSAEEVERARAVLGAMRPRQVGMHLMAPAVSRMREAVSA